MIFKVMAAMGLLRGQNRRSRMQLILSHFGMFGAVGGINLRKKLSAALPFYLNRATALEENR